MLTALEIMTDMQDCAPSLAYELAGDVGDMAISFLQLRGKYQDLIKSYELQKLNEMAAEMLQKSPGTPIPDETPTGGGSGNVVKDLSFQPSGKSPEVNWASKDDPLAERDYEDITDYPTISQEQPSLGKIRDRHIDW